MGRRSRVLVAGCLASVAGVGAALALASNDSQPSVPSTGPFTQTTDPSREDYYDQIEHEVPINRIADTAKEVFGPRFGDIAIDREVEPNVLRVYVVDATAADEAELARIADGNPQVALQPANFTWNELLAAKEAVGELVRNEDFALSSIAPDLIAQGVEVTSVKQLDPGDEALIRQAAGSVPVRFAFGPEYKFEGL